MRYTLILLATTMLALSGCATLYNQLFPDSQDTGKAILLSEKQRWWSVFHDPLMDQLAVLLLEQNLDIKIAEARLSEARGLTRVSTSGFFPDIAATGNAGRSNSQIGSPKPATILQGGFDTSWELDVFGRVRSGVSASEARTDAAVANVDDVRNSVIAELMRTVISWRQAQQTLRETKDLLTSQDDQVSLFTSRVKAGLIDATFLERARAQREQTATQLPEAEAAAVSAQYQIEHLLGKSPGELADKLEATAGQPLYVPSAEKTLEVKIDAIRQRPDVRAAKAQMFASHADLDQSEAALLPQLNLKSFFGAEDVSKGVITAGNPIWSLASGAALPLLNFGKLRGAVDAAGARDKQSELVYENTVLVALQESKTALSDYLNGVNAVTQQDAALKHRKDTVRLAKKRFERGLTDMTDLTTAESELDQATIALIEKKANAAIAYIRLQKALGIAAVRT